MSKEDIYDGYQKVFGVPITKEQVDSLFDKVDIDGSGSIDYTEFVMATMNEKLLVTRDRLMMAFKTFDADGSGALSPEEILDVLRFDDSIDPKEIESMIHEFDENGDGEI